MHDSGSDPHVAALHVRTETHGRVLLRPAADPAAIVVGFHGYAEDAATQLERLTAMPGAADWTCVAVQGLHRFYRGRTEDTVAGWMTRQDRELAIADNIAYVDRVLEQITQDFPESVSRSHRPVPLAYVGFSQGVAMAFRAGLRGRIPADAIVGVGGDVPPELLADTAVSFPRVLLIRGDGDEWYTAAKLESDESGLANRSVSMQGLTVEARHEWTPAISDAIAQFLRELSLSRPN